MSGSAAMHLLCTRLVTSSLPGKNARRYPGNHVLTCGADALGPGLDRFAFLLRSLKTQEELETLRAVYGPRLIVLAAYSPKAARTVGLGKCEGFADP